MDKKYQIFISSTYKDLKEERDDIMKEILSLYHIPIGMEMFSAEDEDQWEIIRRTIDKCDYYILVLGLRYGSQTADGISFTQKEYQYALSQNIPILSFLLDENVPLAQSNRDDNLDKINNFRQMVLTNNKMCDFWKDKGELIAKVIKAITKQIMQKPRIGWVRGDTVSSAQTLEELASLSKENRELRDKIKEYESKLTTREPKLQIKINEASESLTFKYEPIDYTPISLPQKIDINSIDEKLKPYLNINDVEIYNNSHTQEEIDEYNKSCEIWYRCKNKYNLINNIELHNIGNSKASEIYVKIKFPNEVIIYQDDYTQEAPTSPIKPNPLELANERLQKAKMGLQSITSSYLMENFSQVSRYIQPTKYNHPFIPNAKNSIYLEDNAIIIRAESLVHNLVIPYDENYKIVPLQKGTFEIAIMYFCAELENKITETIALIVE